MKIGIVNDSSMAVQAMARTIESRGKHQVVWTAGSGLEALARCEAQRPDLVLMDLVMPGLNGVETTRRMVKERPTAILVVTASVGGNCGLAFQAMGEGALDVIATPALGDPEGRAAFLKKIDQIGALLSTGDAERPNRAARQDTATGCSARGLERLVAIGCSAGGPAAAAEILRRLPPQPAAAVVIVQHIDPLFVQDLCSWLDSQSAWPVRVAREGAPLTHGTVWLADSSGNLTLDRQGMARYRSETTVHSCRPSVDMFLDSAATVWPGKTIAAILTGMGSDGAQGLLALRRRGFTTLAQDQATSAVFGMPKAAAQSGAASRVLPLVQIADHVACWIQEGH